MSIEMDAIYVIKDSQKIVAVTVDIDDRSRNSVFSVSNLTVYGLI